MRARSLTEAVTNQTVFSSEELHRSLPGLFTIEGRPPASLMPTFLHEATHHWCFVSPVGSVLAMLALRSQVNALRATEAAKASEAVALEKRAAEDLTRAQVTFMLLHPLAEGLATFAEFDLSPGLRSPVVPPPLRWASLFFARRELYGNLERDWVRRRLDAFELTAGVLAEARASAATRQRKEALLVEPLSCASSEGYLAGYLFVKNLKRLLASIDDRYSRAPTFLLFLHKVFYKDPELRRLLLDESHSLPESLELINFRIQELFKYFGSDIAPDLSAFFDSLAGLEEKARARGDMLPLADDADPTIDFLNDWRLIFGRNIEDLGPPDTWTASERAEVGCHATAYSRDLLNLGFVNASLQPDGEITRIMVGSEQAGVLPTVGSSGRGVVSGNAGVFLSTRSGHHIAYAMADREVLALGITPRPDADTTKVLMRRVLGRAMLGVVNYEIQAAEEKINALDELRRVTGYVQQTRDQLDAVYCRLALMGVPKSRQTETAEKMMTEGFYGLFDRNADLVRGLAAIGTQADMLVPPDKIEADFGEIGLEYEPVMRALQNYADEYKLFTILKMGGMLHCTL